MSEYLTRTPTSSGNRKVFTYSFWIKRNKLTDWMRLVSILDGSTDSIIQLTNDDKLRFRDEVTSPDVDYISSRALRDVGNWMHIVVSIDMTAIQAEHRIRMYINGDSLIEYGLDTESMSGDPNLELNFNKVGLEHRLFARNNDSEYFIGQASDVFMVDGQALTPDVFGFNKEGKGYISAGSTQSTDFRPGQWLPKSPRVIKTEINRRGGFGVNGFYLPMNDSSNFGADFHCDPNTIITLKDESVPQPKNGAPTTSDNYISELRSDSNASNLVLAVPGIIGAPGVAYTDFSANIKGSGTNKVLTANGNAGVALTDSYYGSAMEFDGTGDYFSGTYNADFNFGTGDFTIEMWAQPKTVNSIDGLFAVNGGSGANRKIIVHLDNGTPKVHFGHLPGSSNAYINSAIGITADQWHHLAFERNGSSATWYVNGVATGITTALSQDVTFTNQPLYIGYGGEASFNSFDGFIQDLRVYSVAKYKGGFDVSKPHASVGIETFREVPDVCVNNFATFNPSFGVGRQDQLTYTKGNLKVVSGATSGSDTTAASNMAIKGKIYCEFALTDDGLGAYVGVMKYNTNLSNSGTDTTASSDCWIIRGDNEHKSNGDGGSGASYGTGTFSTGDIIMLAVDIDNTSIWFGKNGTWYASGDPSSNSNAAYTNLPSTDDLLVICGDNYSSETPAIDLNFGQNPTFGGTKTAGTNTDANGRGLFTYTVPTGFLALCEDNLPTPAIADPGEHFKTVLYNGDGNSGRSITGVGFKPDFVWIKERSNTSGHALFDSVRGPGFRLVTDTTAAEDPAPLVYNPSFNNDGFTVGTDGAVNQSGQTYVAWCWKAGGAATANTDGSINSTVSVNQTAGFSIVSYTGTGSAGTVGHGLGKRPKVVIVKDRDGNTNWPIFFDGISNNTNDLIQLNLSNATATASTFFNGGDTTTTTFPLGTGGSQTNASGNDHIAYCWAEIEGYSKFGSYVGNANADGTFVYCGFKPAFVITKRTDGTSSWLVHDSSRDPINPVLGAIYTNSSDAEGRGSVRVDFVSNGFKHRNSDGGAANNYANAYIFMAFAESPFQTANAK
jgi:hypothetical protein